MDMLHTARTCGCFGGAPRAYHKWQSENVPKFMNFWVFSGCFQGGSFRNFFPNALLGISFGPFQVLTGAAKGEGILSIWSVSGKGRLRICGWVQSWAKDASFLLTIEVFLLRFVFFTYGGGTVSKKDQTQFPDRGNRKQKRPNSISGGREP